MTSITTRLTAKILSYHFNAQIDAQLSAEIVSYLKQRRYLSQDNESRQRAEAYVQLQTRPTPEFLAGLAYTLYYGNGLANHLYARLLTNFLPLGQKKRLLSLIERYVAQLHTRLTVNNAYQEFAQSRNLVRYWPQVVSNSFRWRNDFLVKNGLSIKSVQPAIWTKTAKLIQTHNIKFNHQVAQALLSTRISPLENLAKVKLLRAAAAEFPRPELFLTAAANTQRAAAKWDELYYLILKK